MTILFVLLATGCGPTLLAEIPEATRLAELANGELLVGTHDGELWRVNSFGDTAIAAKTDAPVRDLVTDPLGRYWILDANGNVWRGGLWVAPERLGSGAALLARGCEDTVWYGVEEAAPGVTALGLGASCDAMLQGKADGRVEETSVSSDAIVRVQLGPDVLWVDARGSAGCLGGCGIPSDGVVDAQWIHLAPFIPGELAWLDKDGGLWLDT